MKLAAAVVATEAQVITMTVQEVRLDHPTAQPECAHTKAETATAQPKGHQTGQGTVLAAMATGLAAGIVARPMARTVQYY